MITFIAIQTILVPILGLIWMGMIRETRKREQLYYAAVETVRITRGYRG